MTQQLTRYHFPAWPAAIASAQPDALHAVLQFFTAEVANPNTRRAYVAAVRDFFQFTSDAPGAGQLGTITSLHVSSWIEQMVKPFVAER